MISSERTAEIYTCLKLHYTTKYDYIKNKGRLKTQPKQNLKVFSYVSERYQNPDEVEKFLFCNMSRLYQKSLSIPFVSSMTNSESYDYYKKWHYAVHNSENVFVEWANNLSNLKGKIKSGNILKDVVMNKINIDSISLFLYKCQIEVKTDDPVLSEMYFFCKKHGPLLEKSGVNFDIKKVLKSINKS